MSKTKGQRNAASSSRRRERSGYEVGYCQPPKHTRFKPGNSGNPKGRPKGAKNEVTILRNILNRQIDSRQDGKVRKISVLEGILLRFTEDALKGNPKSAAFLLNRYHRGSLALDHHRRSNRRQEPPQTQLPFSSSLLASDSRPPTRRTIPRCEGAERARGRE